MCNAIDNSIWFIAKEKKEVSVSIIQIQETKNLTMAATNRQD